MRYLGIFLILFWGTGQLIGQTDRLTVGDVPLDSLPTDIISVSFEGTRPFVENGRRLGSIMVIEYGQTCMGDNNYLTPRAYFRACSGVMKDDETFVRFYHYVQGIKMLEEMGWELDFINERSSDGNMNSFRNHFIFRRKITH